MAMNQCEALANSATDSSLGNENSGAEIRQLASGRSVVLHLGGGKEEIELRNPDGEMEVRIVMTEAGPAVTLRSARLAIETIEDVQIRCRDFGVEASNSTVVKTGELDMRASEKARVWCDGRLTVAVQEAKVRAGDDICLNGAKVRIQSP